MSRFGLIAFVALCVPLTFAQNGGINWGANPQQGIALAQRNLKPIMFYVVAGTSSQCPDIIRDQRAAFADPLVLELAGRFVPIRLTGSVCQQELARWGLPTSSSLMLVFTKPDGTRLGELSQGSTCNPASVASAMSSNFDKFRKDLFDTELKPRLESERIKDADVRKVLQIINSYAVVSADAALIEFVARSDISPALEIAAYESLAILSTPTAVDALWQVAGDNPKIAKLLEKGTPEAAAQLLKHMKLNDSDPARFQLAYDAVTRICKIKGAKPAQFWATANSTSKNKEIKRVSDAVRSAAKRWKETNAKYR